MDLDLQLANMRDRLDFRGFPLAEMIVFKVVLAAVNCFVSFQMPAIRGANSTVKQLYLDHTARLVSSSNLYWYFDPTLIYRTDAARAVILFHPHQIMFYDSQGSPIDGDTIAVQVIHRPITVVIVDL